MNKRRYKDTCKKCHTNRDTHYNGLLCYEGYDHINELYMISATKVQEQYFKKTSKDSEHIVHCWTCRTAISIYEPRTVYGGLCHNCDCDADFLRRELKHYKNRRDK